MTFIWFLLCDFTASMSMSEALELIVELQRYRIK
ncbi:uncharacterized protein METZ01_LOCUS29498 [marine metagenome]|uniref:Uncharacterized protein n=1 Tax=marine metagenome TaxID=408172 RepID=A0A381QCP5_9ZZZZ